MAAPLSDAGDHTDQDSRIDNQDILELLSSSPEIIGPNFSDLLGIPPDHREVAVDGMKPPFYIQSNKFPLLMDESTLGGHQPESDSGADTVLITAGSGENLNWGPNTTVETDKIVKAIADKIGKISGNQTTGQRNSTSMAAASAQFGPGLARTNSSRPPPPTPPESMLQDQLSMPTLPALHHNSVAALIEKYCLERAANPEKFDRHTEAIKMQLVLAKIERGGTDQLLRNEYTAELASRLDAQAVQFWSEVRQRDQNDYAESEGGDQDHDTLMSQTPGHGQQPTATGRIQGGEGLTAESASAPTFLSDEASILRELRELNLSDHVAKVTTSGNIRFQSKEIRKINETSEKRTFKTWIEITQDVEVAGEQDLDLRHILDAIRTSSERDNKAEKASERPASEATEQVIVNAEDEVSDPSSTYIVMPTTETLTSCTGECIHCNTCTDRITSMSRHKSQVDAVLRDARARQDHVDARLEHIQQQLTSALAKNSKTDPASGLGIQQTAHVPSKYDQFFKTREIKAAVPDKDKLFASLSDFLALLYTGHKMGEAVEVIDDGDNDREK